MEKRDDWQVVDLVAGKERRTGFGAEWWLKKELLGWAEFIGNIKLN